MLSQFPVAKQTRQKKVWLKLCKTGKLQSEQKKSNEEKVKKAERKKRKIFFLSPTVSEEVNLRLFLARGRWQDATPPPKKNK